MKPHKHRYAPDLARGENPDGSARVWACSCGGTITFDPLPLDVAGAHVHADIVGNGLRSTRRVQ